MSAPFKHVRLQHVLGTGEQVNALVCAQNVYAAIDRRMPEARALASWLTENAVAFGLNDAALPDEGNHSWRSRRNTVSVEDWLKVREALDAALATPARVSETPIAC